jgi:serine/threonine-protein kinase
MASNEGRDQSVPAANPVSPTPGSPDLPTRIGDTGEYKAPPKMPRGPLQPGQTLGQYRILERLGAGGMGEVYKALHVSMDRVVALKVLAPDLVQEQRARARFQREIKGAARLNHPNIVMAHDADEAEGHCFLVMEYVEGSDLADLVRQRGRPPAAIACEIARQAALGLQHAHECGLVHRDIKPANLMLVLPRPSGAAGGDNSPTVTAPLPWPGAPVVKILDFGLARLVCPENEAPDAKFAVTREGTVVGTPEFMSPEQGTGGPGLDIRSDVYSLGCTLYFLLAGRPPFVSKTVYETITRHLTEPPKPLNHIWPDVHPILAAVVARMLAKRPEARFQTPAEVAQALLPWSTAAKNPSAASATQALDAPKGVSAPPTPAPFAPRGLLAHPPNDFGEGLRKASLWLILVLVIASAVLIGLKYLDVFGGSGDNQPRYPKDARPKVVD